VTPQTASGRPVPPWKVKVVEPIQLPPRGRRRRALAQAGLQCCRSARTPRVTGLRMTYEPESLRFLQARFEPVGAGTQRSVAGLRTVP
jgi:tryptophanase